MEGCFIRHVVVFTRKPRLCDAHEVDTAKVEEPSEKAVSSGSGVQAHGKVPGYSVANSGGVHFADPTTMVARL